LAVDDQAIIAAFTLSNLSTALAFALKLKVISLPIKSIQSFCSIACAIPNFLLVVSTSNAIDVSWLSGAVDDCVTSTISLPSLRSFHLSKVKLVSALVKTVAAVKEVPRCATEKSPFIMRLSALPPRLPFILPVVIESPVITVAILFLYYG